MSSRTIHKTILINGLACIEKNPNRSAAILYNPRRPPKKWGDGRGMPYRKKERKRSRSGPHPRNALSAAFVRQVDVAGRYCDGHGLYLEVAPGGSSRHWLQRLAIRGRRCELGLGGFPLVTLSEAREQALANRRLARAGGDPLAEKRRSRGIPTFAAAAARVLEQKRAGWRNPKHAMDWPASLERHAFPIIGERSVSEITTADVLAVLQPLWHAKPETARRLRQRISAVMQWAAAMGHRTDNPCDLVGATLGAQRKAVRHMPALPHAEVAAAVATVRASRATAAAKLAFEFLVLTAARSGEVRLAQWTEIDTVGAVWTVPAERTKANREHRVPLSPRAIEILDAARGLVDGCGLVFPSPRGKPLSDMTLSKLLKEQGVKAVPHGFRPSLRDWAAEATDHPREAAEAALAHQVRDRVEAAYARSTLFERRRLLMNDWSSYLGGEAALRVSPAAAAGGVHPTPPPRGRPSRP